ncbi:hypothetical protein Daus18300_008072 [Diaporthe australafricana]|uniref:Uncharacterized protein n=1 Tax=Diaporthe australafricana TaxID=127596 RepID=A0ABR3WK28_9PEZI
MSSPNNQGDGNSSTNFKFPDKSARGRSASLSGFLKGSWHDPTETLNKSLEPISAETFVSFNGLLGDWAVNLAIATSNPGILGSKIGRTVYNEINNDAIRQLEAGRASPA